jgi:hypothetical protein
MFQGMTENTEHLCCCGYQQVSIKEEGDVSFMSFMKLIAIMMEMKNAKEEKALVKCIFKVRICRGGIIAASDISSLARLRGSARGSRLASMRGFDTGRALTPTLTPARVACSCWTSLARGRCPWPSSPSA